MSDRADELNKRLARRRAEAAAEDRRAGSARDARPIGERLREIIANRPKLRAADDPDPLGLLLRSIATDAVRDGDNERGEHIDWFLDYRKWEMEGRKGNKPWEPNTPPGNGQWEPAKYQCGQRYEKHVADALELAEERLKEWEAADAKRAESEDTNV